MDPIREEEILVMKTHAWIAAWDSRDVDAALAFYADDAVVRVGTPPFSEIAVGKEQVRSFLLGILPGFYAETWDHRVSESSVTFEFEQTSERLLDLGIDPVVGTVRLTFESGKIKQHTVTLTPETLKKMWKALE